MKRIIGLVVIMTATLLMNACESNKGIEVNDVYFSKDLSEEGLKTRENKFYSSDKIYLNVDLNSKPSEGTINTEFFFNNSSLGSDEYVFPNEESNDLHFYLESVEPFRISNNYKAVIIINEEEYGEYNFAVIPPEGAIESKIKNAWFFSMDESEEFVERNIFTEDELVGFMFIGDLGEESWIETIWYFGDHIEGEIIPDCGIALLSPENLVDEPGMDQCLPEDGWVKGEYEVLMYLDDEIADTYQFTIE